MSLVQGRWKSMHNVHFSDTKQFNPTLNMGFGPDLQTDDWATPQTVFNDLNREFDLDIDVCANESNHKLPAFYSAVDDGLSKDWKERRCWMNPPYGRVIGEWVRKASRGGATVVVALLPARTDTKWFHDFIYQKPNVEIRFIKGRLKFGGSKNSAPFPSMIVIFNNP